MKFNISNKEVLETLRLQLKPKFRDAPERMSLPLAYIVDTYWSAKHSWLDKDTAVIMASALDLEEREAMHCSMMDDSIRITEEEDGSWTVREFKTETTDGGYIVDTLISVQTVYPDYSGDRKIYNIKGLKLLKKSPADCRRNA